MIRPIEIITGDPGIDRLVPMIQSFLEKDLLILTIDGKKIRGYRSPDSRAIWLRDYSDILRGIRYFENDLKSVIDHFAETQSASGQVFDYYTTFPEKIPCEKENWTKYVRVPVEADVEYRFVKAAYLAWQAHGDDDWILQLLPAMDKALKYIMSHPWRWDKMTGLVKRAYTIDTWDFAYTGGASDWLQFQVDENTFWGFMHGDNSGYAEAFSIMAFLYAYFGEHSISREWEKKAIELEQNLNRICWNGKYYQHFVKQSIILIPGVDEDKQLSLSNPININRGVTSHDMAVSILREYQERKTMNRPFAEWYSIDPPFPAGIFGDAKLVPGAYVNGGIMPLVGGELARAAFDHGFEKYGVEILAQYSQMIAEKGESFLWYFPDGTPSSVETSTSPDAEPSDGWGSSAMLYALVEGLAGVEDQFKEFRRIKLSPKWHAAHIKEAKVKVTYALSGQGLQYHYRQNGKSLIMEVSGNDTDVSFHVLLPRKPKKVLVNGIEKNHAQSSIEESIYVDFQAYVENILHITIELS